FREQVDCTQIGLAGEKALFQSRRHLISEPGYPPWQRRCPRAEGGHNVVPGLSRMIARVQAFAADVSRLMASRSIGCVSGSIANATRCSPTAVVNLNPWPENPAPTTTPGIVGCRSMMKSPSGVMVYRHTACSRI